MQILIADDSKTNLAILSATLRKLGHTVMPATSGEEAIQLFLEKRPDFIILDVMMEGMNGFECAKKIREINTDDWIPIIFLSASVDDTSIAKGIDAGGDDYLTKPFSEITLAAKIKAMQRIADMRQALFETTQKLYLLSSTDILTGLYNRLQFDRSIKEIIATANKYHHLVALLFLDLDNFKNVNDSFGHHTGDLLLTEVAKRLKACLRSNDFIARLSGDEFAIILSEISDPDEAGFIAQNILDTLALDYLLENHTIRIGASIGISCYPLSTTSPDDLVLNADVAMYHAKTSGRNNYQYYTQELNEKYRQQISLEHALKFALERQELFLSYQPIFNLKTGKIVGLETLLGWDHPKFGLVSPSIFIPIAEETGLMNYIGTWVIQTACQQAVEWSLDKFNDFKFAINISSHQLLHENFYQQVADILIQTNFPPSKLEIELAESTIMTGKIGPFQSTINKLTDFGISIAIDDFGTGYSSLIRLKHLPINALKIEKTFIQEAVKNPNSAIIANCLIALGKNLNLNVIAEGIETKEQLEFLITNGCPEGQGYFLCKPMSAKETKEFLEEQKRNKKIEVLSL